MGAVRTIGRGRLSRGRATALVLGLIPAALVAGAGQATAAPHGVQRVARPSERVAQPGERVARPTRRTAAAGTITTVAGGVGGPAPARELPLGSALPAAHNPSAPCGVAFGGRRLFIGDDVVRAVNPVTDQLTTFAGNGGASSPVGNGGPATQTALQACGVAVDHAGNLVLADHGSGLIRVVAASTGTFYGQAMTKGAIYTVAGDGAHQYGRSGVPATQTSLNDPVGVAIDPAGNLVIGDQGTRAKPGLIGQGARARVVAVKTGWFYGMHMTAGDIYTVAGYRNGVSFSGDGGLAWKAGLGIYADSVAVDRSGNLVISDLSADRVCVVAAHNGTFYGQAMTKGHIYTIAGDGTAGFSGDGGPATSAELTNPDGVAVDAAGNVLIADVLNYRVRVVAAHSGTFYGQAMTADDIYTIAGDGSGGGLGNGGPATSAGVFPVGLAVDSSGDVLIIDGQRVRMVAEHSGTFYGKAMTAGDIYPIAGSGAFQFFGDGGPATRAEINVVFGGTAAVDGAGNLVIADSLNNRIRMVAAAPGTFYGVPMTAGNIYTVAGSGGAGFTGDGVPATKTRLNAPQGATVDRSGNLVITDTDNDRIRVVAASTGTFYGQAMTAGDIYTIAGDGREGYSGDGGPATSAELDAPATAAVDGAGNVVITDSGNNRVRVVAAGTGTFYGRAMTAGDIYTIAGDGTAGYSGDGGPATSAELGMPRATAVDSTGNVLIADSANSAIRVVAARTGRFYGQAMTAGDIYTIAGNGQRGYSGDGGPAISAELNEPESVAVDAHGNLAIADFANNRVRVVAVTSGTFYGVPMTAGDIYTVAGNGSAGLFGDGGPGTSAWLNGPWSVAPDRAGDLVIADLNNQRIRLLTGS